MLGNEKLEPTSIYTRVAAEILRELASPLESRIAQVH
jgi:site-specific recombinase XerD